MSAKWIRLQTDFHRHPKTAHLCRLLGQPLADAYVTRTWSFVSDFCPTGHVRDIDGTTLEDACGWCGESGALIAALVESGWLDVSEKGGWDAHDWAEHQGKVAARAAKERERKRAYRERVAATRPADVPRTSHGTSTRDISPRPAQRNVTRRNETRRNVDSSAGLSETPPADAPRDTKPEKPPDPRHAPLKVRLVDAFKADRETPYPFGPRDAKAITNLLARAEPDVIVAAWERALRHQGFPAVSTLAQLESHLATFVGPPRTPDGIGTFAPGAVTGGW